MIAMFYVYTILLYGTPFLSSFLLYPFLSSFLLCLSFPPPLSLVPSSASPSLDPIFVAVRMYHLVKSWRDSQSVLYLLHLSSLLPPLHLSSILRPLSPSTLPPLCSLLPPIYFPSFHANEKQRANPRRTAHARYH